MKNPQREPLTSSTHAVRNQGQGQGEDVFPNLRGREVTPALASAARTPPFPCLGLTQIPAAAHLSFGNAAA